jgi:hypothetical protein
MDVKAVTGQGILGGLDKGTLWPSSLLIVMLRNLLFIVQAKGQQENTDEAKRLNSQTLRYTTTASKSANAFSFYIPPLLLAPSAIHTHNYNHHETTTTTKAQSLKASPCLFLNDINYPTPWEAEVSFFCLAAVNPREMCLPCFPWTWTEYEDPLDSMPEQHVWVHDGQAWSLQRYVSVELVSFVYGFFLTFLRCVSFERLE